MTDYEWLMQSKDGDRAIAPACTFRDTRFRVRALLSSLESTSGIRYDAGRSSVYKVGAGIIDFVNVAQLHERLAGRKWTHYLGWYGPPHPDYTLDEIEGYILPRIRS